MIKSSLYTQVNYKPQVPCVVNTFIYEYDMSKANISILKEQNAISDGQYNSLYTMGKEQREITVGLMCRDNHDIIQLLKQGIIDAKKKLFDQNNIEDYEVLAIKNDAVFIIGRELTHTKVGNYTEFIRKNIYTIFLLLDIRYNRLEVYYSDQVVNGQWNIQIDVKGIQKDALIKHANGMISLISEICYMLETGQTHDILMMLMSFYDQYINRKLSIDYYREFNARSQYLIKTKCISYYMDDIDQAMIPYIDINCNLLVLRELIKIVSNIYNR